MQGEKRETSTKNCNETILRDKLRVFVSLISPPFGRPNLGFPNLEFPNLVNLLIMNFRSLAFFYIWQIQFRICIFISLPGAAAFCAKESCTFIHQH